LQLSNSLINRKIVLHEVANNEHQYIGLGVNMTQFRFQVPDNVTRYAWFAGSSTSTSNELMRLNGNGTLSIGNTNSTHPLDVTGTIRSTTGLFTNVGIGTSPAFPLHVVGNTYCDGIITATNRVIPTQIQDGAGLPSTGVAGQYLAATGTGILWTNRPLPYAASASAVGSFSTTAPVPGSAATVTFAALPRGGRYRLTTNIVAFPTAGNVTVTVEIYTRQVSGGAWALLYNTQTFMNSINIHLAFPAKSEYISLSATFLEVFVRTGANTGSNASDPVNIDILECNTL
jgi:hypothetical protein